MADRAFVPSDAGFRAIANGPEVRRALAEVAEKGKTIAESISPHSNDIDDHYRDSFEVVPTTVEWTGKYPGPRAAVQVRNTSGHAPAVEFGNKGVVVYRNKKTHRFVSKSEAGNPDIEEITVDYPAHRVLGRTLEFLEADGK